MVNRPKQIGTAGETAVVRYLVPNGFPQAERRTLRGTKDMGDVTGIPDVVIEVKAGHAAWNASDNQISLWLGETEVERINAAATVGLLVVARQRKAPAAWWCVMTLRTHQELIGSELSASHKPVQDFPVYTTLARAAHLLRTGGWGDPLPTPLPEGTPE